MNIAHLLRRIPRKVSMSASEIVYVSQSCTHVGRVRCVNEDRLLDRPDRRLWAVVDGMGGHMAGAAAATSVIDILQTLADGSDPIDAARVHTAMRRANHAIYNGMSDFHATSGATVVVALIEGREATIFWAGDSRAYLIRCGKAERLTHDHSVVQELVDAGVLNEAAANHHPQANVVTRALGVGPAVELDSVTTILQPNDRLLLCSDGVSRSLDPRDFATMPGGIGNIAERFLENALQRDGSDNATLVVIEKLSGL